MMAESTADAGDGATGWAVGSQAWFTGAMLHVAVHAVVKCGLFLTAGVFVYYFDYTRGEQLTGVMALLLRKDNSGRRMPVKIGRSTTISIRPCTSSSRCSAL